MCGGTTAAGDACEVRLSLSRSLSFSLSLSLSLSLPLSLSLRLPLSGIAFTVLGDLTTSLRCRPDGTFDTLPRRLGISSGDASCRFGSFRFRDCDCRGAGGLSGAAGLPHPEACQVRPSPDQLEQRRRRAAADGAGAASCAGCGRRLPSAAAAAGRPAGRAGSNFTGLGAPPRHRGPGRTRRAAAGRPGGAMLRNAIARQFCAVLCRRSAAPLQACDDASAMLDGVMLDIATGLASPARPAAAAGRWLTHRLSC